MVAVIVKRLLIPVEMEFNAPVYREMCIRDRHNRGNCIAVGHGAGGNIEGYLYHNSIRNPDISNVLPISSVGRVVSDDYRIMAQFIYSPVSYTHLDVYKRQIYGSVIMLVGELPPAKSAAEKNKQEELLLDEQ